MKSGDLPSRAAWVHESARDGFECVFPSRDGDGFRLDGHTAAVEGDRAWAVQYAIAVDERWRTRSARIVGFDEQGRREAVLEADGEGRWLVDGNRVPALDGCLDVDLESSACTNTLPVHRLGLPIGGMANAPAVYVRATGLGVERLEQRYARISDDGGKRRYDYQAASFDFEARLVYDSTGFVIDYPGIARRVL